MAPNVNEVSLISDTLAELELSLHSGTNDLNKFVTSSPFAPLDLAVNDDATEAYWQWPHREERRPSLNQGCVRHDVLSLASLEERLLQDAAERRRSPNKGDRDNATHPEHDSYWQWSYSQESN